MENIQTPYTYDSTQDYTQTNNVTRIAHHSDESTTRRPVFGHPHFGHGYFGHPYYGHSFFGGAGSLLPFLFLTPFLYNNAYSSYPYPYPYPVPYPYPYGYPY